jgi:ABC-type arginine/histidine transport system permease subunit
MKARKWAATSLALLVTIACVVSVFLGIWSTGDFWPIRFTGSAFALFVVACPLWLATFFLWDGDL